MSRKLTGLIMAVVGIGLVAALAFGLSDSPAVGLKVGGWQQAGLAYVPPGTTVAFAQVAPSKPGEQGGGAAAPDADAGAKSEEPEAPAAEAKANSPEEMLSHLGDWVKQDPRDITTKKFEDLSDKLTEPWNEDNPETYIPNTGRNDPLTRVRDAVPDELRPPRVGEDDENQIETYLFSQMASEALEAVASRITVYSVVQIGLTKLVTIGGAGLVRTVEEGEGFGVNLGIGGFAVAVQISVASVSTDEVMLSISATPQGSRTTISKTLSYIPGTPSTAMDGGGGGGGFGPRRRGAG